MVSVIIPVYNGERYIDGIFEDLSKQAFHDFEVVFVDDGSADASYDRIEAQMQSGGYWFPINIIRQENKGVSAARNAGLENAKGDYICFVDVDDGIKPDYLSYLYDVIRKTGASIAMSKCNSPGDEQEERAGCEREYSNGEALERYLFHQLDSGLYRAMVSADLIRQNGLRFAEGYRYGEDVHMVWKILQCSGKVVETDRVLYVHKQNEGSAMSRFDRSRMDSIALLEDLEGFFQERNPAFYPLFKKYAKARMVWAVLWQAACYLDYAQFSDFVDSYHLREQMKNLLHYRQRYVVLSSVLFLFSGRLYYGIVRKAGRRGGI